MKQQDFSAIILAGGKNTRFSGRNKTFFKVNGIRIIDSILNVLQKIFPRITIVTNNPSDFSEFKSVHVIKDLIKSCGPLCGIYTGLKVIDTEFGFFVACDMPFLHAGLVQRLVKTAKDKKYDCVVPYTDKGIEPLHGVYSGKILPKMESLMTISANFSVTEMLNNFNCKYVKIKKEELISIFNVNTGNDLEENGNNDCAVRMPKFGRSRLSEY